MKQFMAYLGWLKYTDTYNMYLQDNMYSAYGYPLIGCKEFPHGFDNQLTYLMTTNTMKG